MGKTQHRRSTILEREPQVQEPRMYRVLLVNDDFTPMDYVVHILKTYFHKPHDEAVAVMMAVHQQGKGLCGIFPYDLAETKVALVTADARQRQHPLRCIMEKE
ncbi:ATP-dependent Clp protease adapter protein clpS [Acidithiobacillus ferrivorans SS3]|uniref:ATP-dependent Clp protease adapter protein ClpS n=3 Tax=Acidithiobacillus ferrivorans TaxID=160808 RepID=A0A060URK0_9PROT|nr:ATP-dependent Clp protease adapter ClpS [Acidithiobacillus ferrivorans]MBN6740217.1 ATP-dependent Clp protease adapter ClpS [Acidithiobacillus sp. MC6.1]AEM47129.1 ATP-dependent Clp protease adapter protein clpS [Acidithiobacillus ferrivorans SS3]MBU2766818.1 ATP-dependent Clp protease adapter ClpS [Acidithiobacillus ferrivorans]MBU2851421.1 ATP-dependent Clp protease adapter ClpS [Acidithiobacillus ferrivorans]OCB02783.1 ATP-dependent Clp protease adaptor ClpS [Acidithiobacillus ferrivoran